MNSYLETNSIQMQNDYITRKPCEKDLFNPDSMYINIYEKTLNFISNRQCDTEGFQNVIF